MSSKRNVTVLPLLPHPSEILKTSPLSLVNSALTPILLLFVVVFAAIFETQLTPISAAEKVAECTCYNSQAGVLIKK